MRKQPGANRLIKLQLLVRQPWRNQEGMARIKKLLGQMGMEITTEGLASLSVQMQKPAFQMLFHTSITEVYSQPPKQSDFGRSSGYASNELPIPPLLQEMIESISVPPPHIRLK